MSHFSLSSASPLDVLELYPQLGGGRRVASGPTDQAHSDGGVGGAGLGSARGQPVSDDALPAAVGALLPYLMACRDQPSLAPRGAHQVCTRVSGQKAQPVCASPRSLRVYAKPLGAGMNGWRDRVPRWGSPAV
jgi:hypothetical protein